MRNSAPEQHFTKYFPGPVYSAVGNGRNTGEALPPSWEPNTPLEKRLAYIFRKRGSEVPLPILVFAKMGIESLLNLHKRACENGGGKKGLTAVLNRVFNHDPSVDLAMEKVSEHTPMAVICVELLLELGNVPRQAAPMPPAPMPPISAPSVPKPPSASIPPTTPAPTAPESSAPQVIEEMPGNGEIPPEIVERFGALVYTSVILKNARKGHITLNDLFDARRSATGLGYFLLTHGLAKRRGRGINLFIEAIAKLEPYADALSKIDPDKAAHFFLQRHNRKYAYPLRLAPVENV